MSSPFSRRSSRRVSLRRAGEVTARALIEPLETRQHLSATPLLKPDHIVVVIESDRFTNAIGDIANLPYVNQLAGSGLVFSNYQGINASTVGGETNYLGLYSGSDQGVIDNGRGYTFAGANLAQSLNSSPGLSFAGYSESLPVDGSQVQQASDGTHPDLYTRSHNPMAMFTAVGTGKTNADVNKTFDSFKALALAVNTYANLPTVSFVIPNNLDNTNGSNESAPYSTDTTAYSGLRQGADNWLRQNLDGYVQWAKTHNSLLLIVGNEGDRQRNFAAGTQTIIAGDPRLIVAGTDTGRFNHFNTLRTIEDMYGVSPLGNSATATDLDSNAAGQLAAPATVAIATGTAVISSTNPAVAGQSISFTATVAHSGGGTPTGSVNFLDGATSLGAGALNASGIATISTGALSVGSHSITAAYGGDVNFSASSSSSLTQVVTQSFKVKPDHIVILIEEDRAANALGDSHLPYLNQLASGGLIYSNSHALNTSAQAGELNYLALYSGSTQGVTDDGRGYSFTGPNLGKSLNSAPGLSFASYAESLPSDGSQVQQATDGTHPDLYTRSYNAAAMFTDAGTGKTNADVNKTFDSFKSLAGMVNTYANLPTVSFIIPNNLNNTHGSNESAPYATDPSVYDLLRQNADTWLQQNVDAYVQWARTHNSLLIITGDEGDRAHNFAGGVTTIVTGDPRLFVPGTDATSVNHYNLLRTLEDVYGVAPLGNSASVSGLNMNALGQLAAPVGQLATTTTFTSSANPSVTNQTVTFTANVVGSGTPTGSVTFKDGTTILGTTSLNATGTAVFTTATLSVATHAITASYSGDATFQASVSSSLSQSVTAAAAPVNDSFANHITLTGNSASTTGTTVNATKQTGEPKHAGNVGGKSVWWTWTSPASGTVTVDTIGSTFDTLLATYTGTSVSALTGVANGSNDDSPVGNTTTSLVKFSAVAGTVYQIAVDGYNGLSGNVALHLNLVIPVPAAPTNVVATQGTLPDRVRITWAPPTGATGFEVYRGTTNNSAAALKITAADVTGSFFDDLTALSGSPYFYWVKAKNFGGTSGFSAGVSGNRA